MLYLYYLSLIFLNIPFIKLPGISSSLFNTSLLSRFLSIVILISILFFKKNRKILFARFKEKKISTWILLIFIVFGLSSLPAINPISYLTKAESIFFSIIIYFNTLFYLTNLKKSLKGIIFLWLFVNILNEAILFLNSSFYLHYISPFLYDEQASFIANSNAKRRLLLTSYNEIFVPFILIQSALLKINSITLITSLFTIVFLAFVSGWRIRALLIIISFFVIFVIKKQTIIKKEILIYGTIMLFFFLVFISKISFSSIDTSVDRLFLNEESATFSNETRFSLIKESYDIFLSHPLLGVGLNNSVYYREYDYINMLDKKATQSQNLFIKAGGHSFFVDILTETGLIGFITLISFFIYCIKQDFILLKKNYFLNMKSAYMLAFWLLVIFSLFHSIQGYRFYSILFIIRASI